MAIGQPAGSSELELHLLVLRCQAGEERAFAALYERFAPRTLEHLRSLVGEGAEDLQQEVWLAVYRNLRALSNPGAFRTWLFQTTRHRALDQLRSIRRETELLAAIVVESAPVETAEEGSFPILESGELDGLLGQLPPLQREAVLLRYRDELSYAEIALVTGCPIGTVRSRLHQARRRLHELAGSLNKEIDRATA